MLVGTDTPVLVCSSSAPGKAFAVGLLVGVPTDAGLLALKPCCIFDEALEKAQQGWAMRPDLVPEALQQQYPGAVFVRKRVVRVLVRASDAGAAAVIEAMELEEPPARSRGARAATAGMRANDSAAAGQEAVPYEGHGTPSDPTYGAGGRADLSGDAAEGPPAAHLLEHAAATARADGQASDLEAQRHHAAAEGYNSNALDLGVGMHVGGSTARQPDSLLEVPAQCCSSTCPNAVAYSQLRSNYGRLLEEFARLLDTLERSSTASRQFLGTRRQGQRAVDAMQGNNSSALSYQLQRICVPMPSRSTGEGTASGSASGPASESASQTVQVSRIRVAGSGVSFLFDPYDAPVVLGDYDVPGANAFEVSESFKKFWHKRSKVIPTVKLAGDALKQLRQSPHGEWVVGKFDSMKLFVSGVSAYAQLVDKWAAHKQAKITNAWSANIESSDPLAIEEYEQPPWRMVEGAAVTGAAQ